MKYAERSTGQRLAIEEKPLSCDRFTRHVHQIFTLATILIEEVANLTHPGLFDIYAS